MGPSDEALRRAEPHLLQKYKAYAAWGLDKLMPKEEQPALPYEELVRDRFIIGTPEECQQEIRRYQRALGVNYFLVRLQWPGCLTSSCSIRSSFWDSTSSRHYATSSAGHCRLQPRAGCSPVVFPAPQRILTRLPAARTMPTV